jgi:hypothetical protein
MDDSYYKCGLCGQIYSSGNQHCSRHNTIKYKNQLIAKFGTPFGVTLTKLNSEYACKSYMPEFGYGETPILKFNLLTWFKGLFI